MKSQSFKLKIIVFFIFSAISIWIIVNATINKITVSNSNVIVTNNKNGAPSNKNETIKKQTLKVNVMETQEKMNKKQKNLEDIWKIGYDQFFQKKYKQSIETETKVINKDSNFYKAYAVKGIALAYSGNFNKGMEQIDQALKLKPNYGYARFNKALTYELFGHYEEAIIWYKKALEVEKFEWSYYGIASIYGRKGDIKNTIKYLKLAIDINPNVKNAAKNEEDFNNVRSSMEFKVLINNF